MLSHWVKFTLTFLIASGLLITGFLLSWYPHSVIEIREAQLNQGGLTQAEIDDIQGSLTWWRAQGIFYYGSASNFMLASGILALVYAIVYSVLSTWRESIKVKQINAKQRKISKVKLKEKETEAFQYEKTRKTEKINFTIASGLLTIIASCIIMVFSVILVVDGIFADNSQFSTQSANYLADGAFGILVSTFALAGGIMILKRKRFIFSIIAVCFIIVKGATFIVSTIGNFWGLFIGTDILMLAAISLIFISISYKEFSQLDKEQATKTNRS